jgi:hypothetical protein
MKLEKRCPHSIIENDEIICKETEGLCFVSNYKGRDYKDCKLYRQIKQEKLIKEKVKRL